MHTRSIFRLAVASLAAVLLSAGHSFAGKLERDRAEELKPLVDEANKHVRDVCGCDVKVQVGFESYASVDDMQRIPDGLDAFSASVADQCNSPANKKAFCDNIASFEVVYGKEVSDPQLKEKKITASSNGLSYNSQEQISAIINKF